MEITFRLNGEIVHTHEPATRTLLDYLREGRLRSLHRHGRG